MKDLNILSSLRGIANRSTFNNYDIVQNKKLRALASSILAGTRWDRTVAQAWKEEKGDDLNGAIVWYPAVPYDNKYGMVVMGPWFWDELDPKQQQTVLVEEILHVQYFSEEHSTIAKFLGVQYSSGDTDKEIQQKIQTWLMNGCK